MIERVAPDHVQWLPVTLVYRKKPLPWGPYWVANWTRKVDCWNTVVGMRLAGEDFKRYNGVLPTPKDKIRPEIVIDPSRVPRGTEAFLLHGSNFLIVTDKFRSAVKRARLTGWAFSRVLVESERWPASEAARRVVHLPVVEPPVMRTRRRAPKPPEPRVEHLRSLVGADAELRVGKGATAAEIKRFERALGVVLPAGYRRFLEACGHADIRHEEILGIGGRFEAETVTKSMREWKELEWPAAMVVVAEDGRGGCYALDTSKMKDGECPVEYFDHEMADFDEETGRITPNFERCKPSFEAWLRAFGKTGSLLPWAGR